MTISLRYSMTVLATLVTLWGYFLCIHTPTVLAHEDDLNTHMEANDSTDVQTPENSSFINTQLRTDASVKLQKTDRLGNLREALQSRFLDTSTSNKNEIEIPRDTAPSSTIQDRIEKRREKLQDQMKEHQEEMLDRFEERKTQLDVNVRARIEAWLNRIVDRYEAAVNRLIGLSGRLQSRIEKYEEGEIDMTESQSLLDSANVQIRTAAGTVADINAQIKIMLGSDTPREVFQTIKELLRRGKEEIKSAHQGLVETIRSIKAVVDIETNVDVSTSVDE